MTRPNGGLRRGLAWLSIIGFLLAAAAVGGAFRFGAKPAQGQDSTTRALPVEVLIAQRIEGHEIERFFTGRVVARRSSNLGFERSGLLDQVLVDEGDDVVFGQPLAVLDTDLLAARLQVAHAQLDGARARLDELLAGARPEVIAQGRERVKEREAERHELELRHQRLGNLLGTDVVSQSEYDEVEQQLSAAAARLAMAEQFLAELEAGTREEQVTQQQAAVAQSRAEIDELELEVDKSTLRATFDGTIGARRADEGAVLASGAEFLRLVEQAAPEARIGVPAWLAHQWSVESQVTVKIADRVEQAEVSALLPELDAATRTRQLVLRLGQPALPGEVVRMVAREPVREPGFWLPVAALTESRRGLWSCLVLEEVEGATRVTRRLLEVLHTDGERAYVRGTLTDGERVIHGGDHRVVVGQRVEVVAVRDD